MLVDFQLLDTQRSEAEKQALWKAIVQLSLICYVNATITLLSTDCLSLPIPEDGLTAGLLPKEYKATLDRRGCLRGLQVCIVYSSSV